MSKNITKIMNRPVNFKVKTLLNNVYHLEFNNQEDLTSTLLRFQEHYESPKFRNKIFSTKKFVKWYKKKHNHKFTYFLDWSGFNFPSYILGPFYGKKFKKLTKREKTILKHFASIKNKFYIIGTYKSKNKINDLETQKHEISHSQFYLDNSYRKKVLNELKKLNLNPLFKRLKKLGYHKSVWLDECHAYLLTNEFSSKRFKTKRYKLAISNLKKIYKQQITKNQATSQLV
jgi:hypothetical protein